MTQSIFSIVVAYISRRIATQNKRICIPIHLIYFLISEFEKYRVSKNVVSQIFLRINNITRAESERGNGIEC